MTPTPIAGCRLERAFGRAARDGRCAIIAYLMCGHPDVDASVAVALALARGGVDAIELGVPFSDPIADGPTIQRAGTASLARGVTVRDCIDVASRVRACSDVPLVLMGYANPLLQYGLDPFCQNAAAAGVDGVIVPDLPPEESGAYVEAARSNDLVTIFLVAPTSTDERIDLAASTSRGFLYCVSLTGVTGARTGLASAAPHLLARARARTKLPLALGFGISHPDHVAAARGLADAVVVGSAIVDLVDRTPAAERVAAVERYVRTLVAAGGHANKPQQNRFQNTF